MNILLSTIGRRSYIAEYFRNTTPAVDNIIGTSDRHSICSEYTVGFLSCDRCFILPSIDSPEYVDAVFDLCKKERVRILCSLYDIDNYVLSKHLDRFFSIGVMPFISPETVNEICFDKYKTYKFLVKSSIGSPETFLTVEDFKKSKVVYPVYIKPRFGFSSIGMYIANSEKELVAYFKPDIHIIQEVIYGQEYGIDIFSDLKGKVLSCVIKKKIRMRAGETDQAITVKDDSLINFAMKIASLMGSYGPIDIDLFVTTDGPYVLDINPRIGGGYPASHAAGANFPQLMVDIALGKSPSLKVDEYRENIVMLKDIKAITMPLSEVPSSYMVINEN